MKDKQEEIWLARIEEACKNNYAPRFFDFFDEGMCATLEAVLKKIGEPYVFWGGMPDAGRKMLCIYPEYVDVSELKWPMGAFRFKSDFPVDHRNILGELMALGINRACLGDIHVSEDEVQVIFTKRLQSFFEENVHIIKGHPVKISWYDAENIKAYALKYKVINFVASSERVDGIIGKIWGFSRQDALVMIQQKRLRVNDKEISKNDFRIGKGDILSLRGKGKAKIEDIDDARTKKGNLRITVWKYI